MTTGVIQLSDLHLGATVDPALVENLNTFNQEIARDRLNIFSRNLKHTLSEQKVHWDGMILAVLGDIIHGERHEEETNDLTLTGQVSTACDLLSLFIMDLVIYCQDKLECPLDIVCLVGNHGELREGKLPSKDQHGRNLEYLIYKEVERDVKRGIDQLYSGLPPDHRVSWHIPKGPMAHLWVYDYGIRFLHGHTLGVRRAALATIERRMRDLITRDYQCGIQTNHVYAGHWHRDVEDYDFTISGAMCGYDEYAYKLMLRCAPPTQTLSLWHPDWGLYQRNKVHCTRQGTTMEHGK